MRFPERREPKEGEGVVAHAKYIGQSFAYLMLFIVTGKDPEGEEDDQGRGIEGARHEVERRKTGAETARTPSEAPSAESVMDARHGSLRVGMDAHAAHALMGASPSVSTLGRRELWNYALGSSPARWQVLVEDGKVVGTYTRGAYRFKRDEAGTTTGAG